MLTASDVLRAFNAPGGAAFAMAEAVSAHAIAEAAACGAGDLVDRFATAAPAAVRRLRAAAPGMLVPWSVHVVPIEQGVRIVLLEATVHLLDVQRALRRKPDVPGAAVDEAVALLAEVADPVAFVEVATGRTAADQLLPIIR